ncbi:MAG: transcriptional regulator [Bacilli bacterium]|nr:transcriptional regulator [Bacilli bacterium]
MEKKSSTSSRLNQIMIERNLKQVDILNKSKIYCEKYGVRLERNDLSQYVSGKVEPGNRKIMILAKALDVNPAWLIGLDVPQSPIEYTNTIDKYNKLSDDDKKLVDNLIESLSKKNNDK